MAPRYIIALVVLAALWGASFLFMRVAVPEFGAIALIEVRVLLASAALLPIWWFRESATQGGLIKEHWRALLVLSALNAAIPFVLFAYSTLFISAGLSALTNSTAPLWGALIGVLFMGQSQSKSATIGLVIGFVGVGVLVAGSLIADLEKLASGAALWTLSAVLAGVFAASLYAISAHFIGRKLVGLSTLSLSTFTMIGATILLFPVTAFSLPSAPISLAAWASVIALGVACTALANLLYFAILANAGAAKALTVTFLIPVFASFWGWLVLSEQLASTTFIGGAVVFVGLALTTGVFSRTSRRAG